MTRLNIKKTFLVLCLITVCLFLYLLALDIHCDQGNEGFELGICSITRYLPF
ncbi:PhoP/PhoQ regulator MgrB [Xenorhabdus bovienii]|uniref:PhoP/PhoQ regulator MgrB n=1 Tax=Xenorhabdus bovienii TaxID=40576 RepID=UPI00237D0F8C|nr:PhoP/PhoQ regulator MgrB [Xenorhabdus bovienii]MDE1486046.1 PhoP/PhoQ regulator MgrB [Xenorhabdus bovienii]MDE9427257.1 PhoP/PhoQ regulator MgrB [Xenorhabdus bovienii]MDE9435112.1 PhoP/PhoQ regulator MgrB [Xenorhabdus bovienii]MDE9440134.1 PhoP/PhoQ regulator MgrB [Xenorhabdus bovienii]MDE9456527.1 PhoP/PhoQ regulator MgrB [Xenorhabdus bovienii]